MSQRLWQPAPLLPPPSFPMHNAHPNEFIRKHSYTVYCIRLCTTKLKLYTASGSYTMTIRILIIIFAHSNSFLSTTSIFFYNAVQVSVSFGPGDVNINEFIFMLQRYFCVKMRLLYQYLLFCYESITSFRKAYMYSTMLVLVGFSCRCNTEKKVRDKPIH